MNAELAVPSTAVPADNEELSLVLLLLRVLRRWSREDLAHCRDELGTAEWLLQESAPALVEAPAQQIVIRVAGHKKHLHLGVELAEPSEHAPHADCGHLD